MFLLLLYRGETERKRALMKNTSYHASRVLSLLNIHVTIKKEQSTQDWINSGQLIIGNHVSYLDILIILSLQPCLFVTSQEMRKTPGLGWMTEMGGSLYTNRRSYQSLPKEVERIAQLLRLGFAIVLFPEATSYDGAYLRPFRSSLLQAAINAQTPVQPVCIQYQHLNGEPVTINNRDQLFWYGGMQFFPHCKQLLNIQRVEVQVTMLPTVQVSNYSNRQELSKAIFDMINRQYQPIV